MQVAIIGYGHVGRAYGKMFPDAVIYDEPQNLFIDYNGVKANVDSVDTLRKLVNKCDLALVCVPTDLKANGELDTSIVEEVVGWLETPLILIKSALMPGTVDKLVKKTGKKIAVSVEFVGMGNYYIPPHKYPDPNDPRKHQMLIIGGELEVAEACAQTLWVRMSPDIKIHLTTALEAEITKLVENAYGALKVTFINTLMSLTDRSKSSFLRVHQAWQSDPRTDSMHLRTVSYKRGWDSHCWNKDLIALVTYARQIGANDMADLFGVVLKVNDYHKSLNENSAPDTK